MSGAVKKIRDIFQDQQKLTLSAIHEALPELKASQISMAMCYFMKQRYVTREAIPNTNTKGRKTVWLYTYHQTRLTPTPAPTA